MPDVSNSVPATEAAMRLGISRERTVRLIQCGVLRGRRKNGRWLADSRIIEEYLASQRAEELRCSTYRYVESES